MALYGTALTVVQTAITTMLQEHTEADMQGRVFGLLSTMYAGCLPLGMAIFGPLADVVSAVDHGRGRGAPSSRPRLRWAPPPDAGSVNNRDRAFPSGKARSLLAHTMFQK